MEIIDKVIETHKSKFQLRGLTPGVELITSSIRFFLNRILQEVHSTGRQLLESNVSPQTPDDHLCVGDLPDYSPVLVVVVR